MITAALPPPDTKRAADSTFGPMLPGGNSPSASNRVASVTVSRAMSRCQRVPLYTSKRGLVLENISGRYGPFWVAGAEARVEPGADSGPEPMSHPGEELVLVTRGRMSFTIDDVRYDLEEGDSIHFRTVRPHSWANPTSRPARAIWLAIRGS